MLLGIGMYEGGINMPRRVRIGISLLMSAFILLAGCSKEINDNDISNGSEPETVENIFDNSNEEQNVGQALTLEHGFVFDEQQGETKTLSYNGGEMVVDYKLYVEGDISNWGFIVFLGGSPQPYKIAEDGEYSYMHTFEVTSGETANFSLYFIPVTGEQGDELDLFVASIYYPAFAPDMIETSSYGNYHGILEAKVNVIFESDTSGMEEIRTELMKQVEIEVEVTSGELTQEYYDDDGGNERDLDNGIYTELYIDDLDEKYTGAYKLEDKQSITVQYVMYGMPGVEYETIVYLNHVPVKLDEAATITSKTQKGKLTIINFNIDVSKIDESSSIYIISIPSVTNTVTNVFIEKTKSVLLYR